MQSRSQKQDSRRENKNVSFGNGAIDDNASDPFAVRILSDISNPRTHFARFSPGKSGGNFSLPFGGKLCVPANTLRKRDTIICRILLPHDRYKHEPITRTRYDTLSSEIFHIKASCSSLKNSIRLQLPHLKIDNVLSHLVILAKEQDESPWQPMIFIDETPQVDDNFISFETTHLNSFYVIISTPQSEQFDIPSYGCLHAARLNRMISVRVPKTATPVDISCNLQLIPFPLLDVPEHLAQDIVSMTDLVRLIPSVVGELRRAATIKLPLPPFVDDQPIRLEDLAVYQTTRDTEYWMLVDTPLKLKKNSVAFDTIHLTQYCVAFVKPGREQRVCEILKLAEDKLNTVRGDIVPYFHIEGKVWTLWMDCLRTDRLQTTVDHIENQLGLRIVHQTSYLPSASSTKLFKVNPKGVGCKGLHNELILANGSTFEVEISGDLKVAVDSLQEDENPSANISYHDKLEQNYRRMEVVPISDCHADGKSLTGIIRVYSTSVVEGRKCVRTYEMTIDQEAVEDYYAVLLLEAQQAKENLEAASNASDVQRELEQILASAGAGSVRRTDVKPDKPKRDYKSAMESFERLTRPTKLLHIGVSREAKVLSGRSLRVLSTVIEKGVRLAIHLNLAESTVTGLTFDSLASRLNHNEMTYRILLLWKRRTNGMPRDKQVGMLIKALSSMGHHYLASVVAEQHERKEEITEECFERGGDSSDDISSSGCPPTQAPPSSRRASDGSAYLRRNEDSRRISEGSINQRQGLHSNEMVTMKTKIVELRLPSISS